MRSEEHAVPFGVRDRELAVGGLPLSRLAERVGATPFFAYDRDVLDARIKMLRAALPHDVELSYAMKANPMPAVVQHLADRVDRIDVASAGELRTALDTTIPPRMVSFAGPGKRPEEIRQAVAAGVLLEAESRTELERIVDAGASLGLRPRVALRVNPEFSVKGSGMRMGGGPQQFGIDAEEVPEVLTQFAGRGLDIAGFHVFAGSQNLNADLLAEAQERTVETIGRLADGMAVSYLNLGGGFGIPYTLRDKPLDLEVVTDRLRQLVSGPIRARFPDASVVLELGRYLVGECGIYVTRVIDSKVSRGRRYLVVDGGLHHQLAATGNFGQAIRRNYPVMVGNRVSEPATGKATVVGCLCTPLDLLAEDIELPDAQIGDLIVIFQAGAYGLTASPVNFLGHPNPAEVLVSREKP